MASAQQAHQSNLFDKLPGARRVKVAKPQDRKLARGEFPPIEPIDLKQETALWLLGQESIELQRGKRFVPKTVKHPGKMQPRVAGAVIDTYTKPGDKILNPMGGVGTEAVEAAERGRHMVMVEIVPQWARVAYANALRTAHRGAPGTVRVINGDARRLPELVTGAFDHLVTSPPYGEALESRSGRVDGRVERIQAAIARGELDPNEHDTWARKVANQGRGVLGQNGLVASMDPNYVQNNWHMGNGQRAMMAPNYGPTADAVITSPPFGDNNFDQRDMRNMRVIAGRADVVITSPPYADALNQSPSASDTEARRRRLDEAGHDGYKFGPNSAQAQQQRYDAVVTSPPYGDTTLDPGLAHGLHFGRDPEDVAKKRAREGRTQSGYDAMITSPAYGDIRQDGGAHQFGEGSAMTNYSGEERLKKGGRDRSNVGNLKYGSMDKALALITRLKAGETIPESEWPGMEYLETMALIYWHCLHLVKPGGLAVLVLKDYRRDKRRVNLVGDTIRLMTAVGWLYHDRALAVTSKVKDGRVIAKVSPFVRINARKPENNGGPLLLPAGEEILVFRKEE